VRVSSMRLLFMHRHSGQRAWPPNFIISVAEPNRPAKFWNPAVEPSLPAVVLPTGMAVVQSQ